MRSFQDGEGARHKYRFQGGVQKLWWGGAKKFSPALVARVDSAQFNEYWLITSMDESIHKVSVLKALLFGRETVPRRRNYIFKVEAREAKVGFEHSPEPHESEGAWSRAIKMFWFAWLEGRSRVSTGSTASKPLCPILQQQVSGKGGVHRSCISQQLLRLCLSLTKCGQDRVSGVCLMPPHTFISIGELARNQQQ